MNVLVNLLRHFSPGCPLRGGLDYSVTSCEVILPVQVALTR